MMRPKKKRGERFFMFEAFSRPRHSTERGEGGGGEEGRGGSEAGTGRQAELSRARSGLN